MVSDDIRAETNIKVNEILGFVQKCTLKEAEWAPETRV